MPATLLGSCLVSAANRSRGAPVALEGVAEVPRVCQELQNHSALCHQYTWQGMGRWERETVGSLKGATGRLLLGQRELCFARCLV